MPRLPQPFLLLLLPFLCHFVVRAAYFSQFSSMRQPERDPCYDSSGRPIRCVPDFINAAYGKPVIASSTCGSDRKPSSFCVVSESTGGLLQEKCELCDPSDPRLAHPAALLTDLNNANNSTCWVSEPTSAYPNNVTLTLSLGKKFEITYVSLHFCGRLADSLAIYKSANRGRSWTPMQFYSTECQKVYQRTKEAPINRENEQVGMHVTVNIPRQAWTAKNAVHSTTTARGHVPLRKMQMPALRAIATYTRASAASTPNFTVSAATKAAAFV
uniref:Laminin N-terminal domain-containing protein n=1 Tax=Globodera pallida TaxID=36090 RepID=A0A183BZ44_GLOPA